MDRLSEVERAARESRFSEYGSVNVQNLKYYQEIRTICEENSCRNFAASWACPPAIGTLAECRERVNRYRNMLLFSRKYALEDSFDFEGMHAGLKDFKRTVDGFQQKIDTLLPMYLLLSNEGCGRCPQCTYPGAPCRFPHLLHHSLEGYIAVILTEAGKDAAKGDMKLWYEDTLNAWEKRLRLASQRIPSLHSSSKELEQYYKRSLISGLVCLWENDAYVTNPFPATSGMDGGSICCYPWDVAGYGARMLVMLLGEQSISFLKYMLSCGIDSRICMALDGSGSGWCEYAYSMWSIFNLYCTILSMTGKGWELFGEIRQLFETEEARLEEWKNLKNYGRQCNLLEMRSCGYEHYVPSPNAERAWCYDAIADIAEKMGERDVFRYREKAEAIRASIRENLWDPERKWFRCVHPDGHEEVVYSIQMYDALRMGACNAEMTEHLLSHLEDGKFLGEYGVSSISGEDEQHYELNDPDWSGGGCYSGEGPELAETLWQIGRSELAWDVLSRHFWMGTKVPYIPQEHFCDSPMMPENKRANIIAGVAGMQAVLFGLAGFQIDLDGSLRFSPHAAGGVRYEIRGFQHGANVIDLVVDGDEMQIAVNGELRVQGEIREMSI